MVTVTSCLERQRKDGSTFITLELTGGVELVQSQTNGRYYATVRKCSVPSTFDSKVAEAMVGQKIDGDIVKVIVEPYEFTNPRTGEVMTLQHSFSYMPKDSHERIGLTPVESVMSA